jgi:hypothetical protein
MIGSGQVYTGQQGNQLATVLGPSRALASYEGYAAKKAADKAKDSADLSKGMMDVKPEEVWHYYSGAQNKTWEDWVNKGAEMMPKGNPFKRYDDEAIQWQIEGSRIKAANENIKQAKSLWDKAMGDINSRGDEYTDEYKEKVKNFAADNPVDVIASGQFNFPQAEFKNPSTIHQDYMVNGLGNLEKAAGENVLQDRDFNNYSISYFSTPEAEKNVVAAKQMFDSLDDATKNAYISEAQNTPGFNGQGWLAYANDQLKNRYKKPPLDIAADALAIANKAELSTTESSIEDRSQVTVSSSKSFLKNQAYPTQQATSYFAKNAWALNEPQYMEALGVDPNLPLEERKKKAINAMSTQIKDNVATKSEYGLSRAGSGNLSDSETKQNYSTWRLDLTSEDRSVSTEAANWLVQGVGADESKVTSAFVSEDYNINEKGKRAYDQYTMGKPDKKVKVLQIVFKDQVAMESAREKMYTEIKKGADNSSKGKAYSDLVDYYRNESKFGTVLKVPITPENEQIINRIHGQTIKQTKEPYKRLGKSMQQKEVEDYFNSTGKGWSKAPKI